MQKLVLVLAACVVSTACSTPRCPQDLIQRGHICRRCPEGSEKRGNDCVTLDGGTVVEPIATDDGGLDDDDDESGDGRSDASSESGPIDASGTAAPSTLDGAVGQAGSTNDAAGENMDGGSPTVTNDGSSSTTDDANSRAGDDSAAATDAGSDATPSYTGLPQQGYIKARNAEASDQFGAAIAISGTSLIVGAPGEDSSADTINGDEANNARPNAGAAYVFVRVGGQWVQQVYLKPIGSQNFGRSVAIHGNYAIVGSRDLAWVFARTEASGGVSWTRTADLRLPMDALEYTQDGDFGASVGMTGDLAVVGAPLSRRGVGDGVYGRGSVLVYSRSGPNWPQSYRFIGDSDPTNAQFTDFGASVSISGTTVAIGAPRDWRGPAGVFTANSGAVYVYRYNDSAWAYEERLKASNIDAEDRFGSAVSVDGVTLAIGAPSEASSTSDQLDDQAANAGAVYVFASAYVNGVGNRWTQQAYVKAPSPRTGDRFGASVSLRGDMLAIGAPGTDSGSGRVYLFRRFGAVWTHQTTVGALPRDPNDGFGSGVAVSDDLIGASSPGESSNAKGVGAARAQQEDNSAPGSGSIYTFARPF